MVAAEFLSFSTITKKQLNPQIGPVYMVACGVPVPVEDHCSRLAELALRLNDVVKGRSVLRPRSRSPGS